MTRKKKPKPKTARRSSRQQPWHGRYMTTIIQPHLQIAIRALKENRQPLNVTTLTKELQSACDEAVQVTRVRQWLRYFNLTPATLPYWEPEAAKGPARNPWPPPMKKDAKTPPLQPLQPRERVKISAEEDAARATALETQEIPEEIRRTLNATTPGAGPVRIPMPGGVGLMGSLDEIQREAETL